MAEILNFPQPGEAGSDGARRGPASPAAPTEPLWRSVLGARLRELRRRRGHTLTRTARRAGISPQYLSEIERGRKEPSSEIVAAVAAGELGGLLVGGVDPGDLADPALALRALENAGFVVSLELRESEVTERADVVLPIAAVAEKSGSFLDWEGRPRTFETALSANAVQTVSQHVKALIDAGLLSGLLST